MINYHADIAKALVGKHPGEMIEKVTIEWDDSIKRFISEVVTSETSLSRIPVKSLIYYHYLSNLDDPLNITPDPVNPVSQ